MARKGSKKGGKPRRAGKANGFKTTTTLSMTAPVRPDRLLVKLPYSSALSSTLTTGGVGSSYNWNLNSIYDPDRTGVGHQPLGHDQWAVFYQQYRVYGVTYDIELTNMNADSTIQGGLAISPAAFGGWTDQAVLEQPHIRKFQLANSSSGRNQARLRGYVSLPQIRGQTTAEYKADYTNNAATMNNSPTALVCLNVLMRSLNTGTTPAVYWTCKLMYHTELFQPPPVLLSSTAPTGSASITFGHNVTNTTTLV